MEIQENITLKEYTTFDIGGKSRYFAEVRTVEDAQSAVAFANDRDLPYFILGGGSNILVSDEGYEGVVMYMKIDFCEIDGAHVHVGAGRDLYTFLTTIASSGLSGLEAMAGVPGSVGGAVRGNAGAFGTEISDVVERVHVLDLTAGEGKVLTKEECAYSYRQSIFKDNPAWLITSVECELARGDRNTITQKMRSTIESREEKHIQDIRSAGSFFMNPEVSMAVQEEFMRDKGTVSRGGRVPAGWLLERTGVECQRIGDIQAGEMHANYFINVGNGTADQAVQLASLAKMRVRDTFDVQLKEEVQMIGFF